MPPALHAATVAQHPTNRARVLRLTTPHGVVETPCFMPVATQAAMRVLTVEALRATGATMVLGGNTYHMLAAPGLDLLRQLGGMHRFMGWDGPLLTDSGGFQVFSLARGGADASCAIDEDGATFRHPESGATVRLTPEASIAAQKVLGADVIMAFDHCTPDADGRAGAEAALARTHRWLARSVAAHAAEPTATTGLPQALFGIVQGGRFRDLREASARFVAAQPVDGVALGGESIGDIPATVEALGWTVPLLPPGAPRYTMGVGMRPADVLAVTAAGADLFDCVAPTRNARHGRLYTTRVVPDGDWLALASDDPDGELRIQNARYATDDRPVLEGCDCETCQRHSRAYLRFLLKSGSALYAPLACAHNVRVMVRTCEAVRDAVRRTAGAGG